MRGIARPRVLGAQVREHPVSIVVKEWACKRGAHVRVVQQLHHIVRRSNIGATEQPAERWNSGRPVYRAPGQAAQHDERGRTHGFVTVTQCLGERPPRRILLREVREHRRGDDAIRVRAVPTQRGDCRAPVGLGTMRVQKAPEALSILTCSLGATTDSSGSMTFMIR